MKTDFLYALRSLRRSPGFFVVAVATLGLGIAANTAIFSLFYQVLLRSLPVRQPERLVLFHSDPPQLPGSTSADNDETVFSYPLYLQMRDSRTLTGLAARSEMAAQMMMNGVAERDVAEVVTGNFFDVLGIGAHAGRLLIASDDTIRGGNPVLVLAYDFWLRRFGGNPSIVNQTLQVNGQPFTIIGIAPENFRGILAGVSPDIYVPMSMHAALDPKFNQFDKPGSQWLTILGRLAPGVTREQALAELQPRFHRTVLDEMQQLGVSNQRVRNQLSAKRLELHSASQGLNTFEQQWRNPLFVLLAMVLLLLIIGCANLANLLMARGVNRSREIAIRFALGASRRRVAGMLMVECMLLGLSGTALGLLLARGLTNAFISFLPSDLLSGWLSPEINLPILSFSIVLMLVATLLFGLLPAIQSARGASSPLIERTQSSSGGVMHSRPRKVLVAAQIALSLLLLATAGLFGRSLVNLMQHQPGFRPDHLLAFSIDPALNGYDIGRGMVLYRDYTKRLAALPGVTSVSMASSSPLSNRESSSRVVIEGYTEHEDENSSDWVAVGPEYFHTLGTNLLEGREFNEHDRDGASRVVIVNRAFVKRFINGDALGRKMGTGAARKLNMEIVGVVENTNNMSLRETVKPTYYIPFEQLPGTRPRLNNATFFVRSSTAFDTLANAIRPVAAQVDASVPIYEMRPMQQNIDESMYTDRLVAALAIAFGFLALLLTAVGLYGVIAYLVGRRIGEIGIRMVLGAEPKAILAMILGEVGLLLAIGAAAGLAGAIAAGRVVESQLFAMQGFDPMVLFLSVGVLSIVALAAACVPAIRAARVQPLEALRHE